jgi:hypothetical protein
MSHNPMGLNSPLQDSCTSHNKVCSKKTGGGMHILYTHYLGYDRYAVF